MPKLHSQEQKSPKSGTQYNFQEHISKRISHLWNKSGCQILPENHRANYRSDSAQLRTLVLQITLTVHQSNQCTTALVTSEFMQVSPFSSTVTKGHFLWDAFLNVWKCLLFAGGSFAGAWSIDSTPKHKTFLQMAPGFRWSIRLAASWMQCFIWETLEKLFCLMSFAHVQSTSKSKSAYSCF